MTLAPPQPAADDELPSFVSGLRGGWRALPASAILASAVVGALVPWLLPAVLVALAARAGWRRWRRLHPPAPTPQWVPVAPPTPIEGPPSAEAQQDR